MSSAMGVLQVLARFPSYSPASVHPLCRHVYTARYRTLVQPQRRGLTPVRTLCAGQDPPVPEEDVFGTLSDTYSSRTVFRKSSPALRDLQYEEDDEGPRGAQPISKTYRGRRNTPYWYFLQCKAKIKADKLADALDFFQVNMLKEERLQPEESNYTVLIGGCGRVGYVKKAFQLYSDMKKRGLVPTDATYTALFNACAESPWKDSGLQYALKLRKELADKKIELNLITYRSLLKVVTLSSGLQGSFQIFQEIAQKFRLTSPDAFNVLFMGCIQDKELGFRYALQVWRRMLQMGVTPDISTYNLLLRATRDCGLGDAAEVLPVLLHSRDLAPLRLSAGREEHGGKSRDKKRKEGHEGVRRLSGSSPATSGSNGAAIDGSQKPAEMDEAHPLPCVPSLHVSKMPNFLDLSIETDDMVSLADVATPSDRLAMIGELGGVLRKMSEDNVRPTIQTFTLLAELVKLEEGSEATLLDTMDTYAVRPDLTFFNTLVLRRSKTLNLKSALELLPTMTQRGIAPNTHTFCNLARACLTIKEGLQLLEDMTAAGFPPNNHVYSTLINAAIKRLDYEYLTNILRNMRNRNVAPNEVVIRQLEFAAQYPPQFDRYVKKNVYLEKIDGFRGYYNYWLGWMDAEEAEHPWQKYRTKAPSGSKTSTV